MSESHPSGAPNAAHLSAGVHDAADFRYGDDADADALAQTILADLRAISDFDAIDGHDGVATQWNKRMITIAELFETQRRYHRLLRLVEGNQDQL